MNRILQQIVFLLALVLCFFPFVTPPIALAMGLVLALTIGHPFLSHNAKATKLLLQVCVVGLGFGMNLTSVIEAGKTGFFFTVATIFGTLILGYFAGKWFAIAAVGPIVGADANEMSVSLGTIFILNSIALLIFPLIGHALSMTQQQFGIWAAIAIHDTSSVAGAAAKYGAQALQIAMTVKLSRALWIIPVAFGTAFLFKSHSKKISIPWFILFFVLAVFASTYVPGISTVAPSIAAVAKQGLTVTLFLIGAGLSRKVLKAVGVAPLLFGVLLWLIISVVSLTVVLNTL
jgi:uncharacterized membrane protein YadS